MHLIGSFICLGACLLALVRAQSFLLTRVHAYWQDLDGSERSPIYCDLASTMDELVRGERSNCIYARLDHAAPGRSLAGVMQNRGIPAAFCVVRRREPEANWSPVALEALAKLGTQVASNEKVIEGEGLCD